MSFDSFSSGNAARRDELESTELRTDGNCEGRSFTTSMPRESGPKASRREEKGTVPALRSLRETVTGCAFLMDAMVVNGEVMLLKF